VENKSKLKLLSIDAGTGPVLPSDQTILNGTYKPLSRPLFIYINKTALARPEVKEFVRYFNTQGPELVTEVGYVQVPAQVYKDNLALIP
jgi:phosphate transport system substrate-binding protein